MPINAFTVFLAALVTAVATGLGAAPFLFTHTLSRRGLGLSNALAAGLMLAASAMLFYEGAQESPLLVSAGAATGVVFIVGSRRLLSERNDLHVGNLQGADALKALMIVGVMTVHSFTEGVGVGVSYGGGDALGVFITTAIALHNIPEGLAISLVLVPRGTGVWKAAGWSIFSSLPQPLMAVPAYLFVEAFAPLLPAGLGFAAGAMVWMAFRELIPEALDDAPRTHVAGIVVLAAVAMLLFQFYLKA
ncbi:MAG: ZIP family metal transporter [Rhodothermales bacterium]|nr:ZIP family metal transporter [Rhodothermales bacterium]